jgi:UPF0042 nucleotide-binding protein
VTASAKIISFGYGHGEPPAAHVTIDVRRFRDPHVTPEFRELTAADPRVAAVVMATPGVQGVADALIATAHALARSPQPGRAVIAIGCTGGRHRAPAIAAEVARRLEAQGVPVMLVHRDLGCPVIERPALAGAA